MDAVVNRQSLHCQTFVQINKKDLINTCKIKMYDPLGVVLIGAQEFSVSRRFKKALENSLQFLP